MLVSVKINDIENRISLNNVPVIACAEDNLKIIFIGGADITIDNTEVEDIATLITNTKKVIRSVDPRDPYAIKWIETKGFLIIDPYDMEEVEMEAFLNTSLIDHVSIAEDLIFDFAAGGSFVVKDKIEIDNIKPFVEKYFPVTISLN